MASRLPKAFAAGIAMTIAMSLAASAQDAPLRKHRHAATHRVVRLPVQERSSLIAGKGAPVGSESRYFFDSRQPHFPQGPGFLWSTGVPSATTYPILEF